ncbi:MAG: TIGR03564 family F420-dependent LLM class oxidoreductase, partial [Actinomycetota bacterium]|nr:TIGR03564 family F420-dependent LLM class oxidoreductase [Actinomycetota bacterium]
MRIGVFGGDTAGRTIDQVVADARQAEADGFATFVLPQIFGLDNMTVLAIIGRELSRIELGTGVVPTYSRLPITMAQQALTVQQASGNRFTLGIGLSHQVVVETMWGLSFEKPLRHMREYLAILIPLLHEGTVAFTGETMSMQGTIDVAGRAAPAVIVAALGPKMLDLAGSVADGTATWMTGPATLRSYTVPTISAAAERAGRPAPRISASLPVCVTDAPDAAREKAATEFQ